MATENGTTNATPSTTNGRSVLCLCCCQCIIVRLWKYLSVEPAIICYLLPSVLLSTAVENLAMEKSCRVNFKYPNAVCDLMVGGKSENNIDCFEFARKMEVENVVHLLSDRSQVFNETHFINETRISPENGSNTTEIAFDVTPLEPEVCEAKLRSQILKSQLNEYISPWQSILPIILILYAGGWSDKRGQRKICMLIPMFGELGSLLALLIAAIFFKQLPVQFSSILSALFPAMTGGVSLMLMGVYSYLTETTAPESRTIRFGVFSQFVSIVPTIFGPFSGHLLLWLGYVNLLMLCLPLNLLGIYFIIHVIKEPRSEKPATNENSIDNPVFEVTSPDSVTQIDEPQMNETNELAADESDESKARRFVDFINPTVLTECAQIIMRERANHGRAILIYMLFVYFISIGPVIGESTNEYNLTRQQLNRGSVSYAHYSMYNSALGLIGTTVMIALFKKCLKMPDTFIGVVSSALGVVTRILFFYSTTSLMFYIAQTIDLFSGLRVLVLRSSISAFVEANEVARTFSIIAIIEALSLFVFTYGFSEIYEQTLKTWPTAFYFGTLLLMFICVLCFTSLYFILKENQRYNEQMELECVDEKDPATDGDSLQV